MRQKRNWMACLAEGADLAGESILPQTLVEILGDSRVLIEQHRGIQAYSRESVCVRVKYGVVTVTGRGLRIQNMDRAALCVFGRIDAVQLERR